MEMKWYTVYTKPQTEKKVLEQLTNKNIKAYCPLNRIGQNWGEKKFREDPLFKSYVFVKATESELKDVRKISGVVNLVYWLGKPVIINDEEINTMKEFLKRHLNITLEKTEIRNSDFINPMSELAFQNVGQNTFIQNKVERLAVPSLGFILIADTEQTNVTVISHDNFIKKIKFTPYSILNKVVDFNTALRVHW